MKTTDPLNGGSVELSPEQEAATSPDADPITAARDRYYTSFDTPMGYGIGQYLRRSITQPNRLGALLDQGAGTGAMVGGGAGLLAGGILGRLTGNSMPRSAIIAGLLGVGLGAYSGASRQPQDKAAAYRGGGDGVITTALSTDTSLGMQERARLAEAVSRLSHGQKDQLSEMLHNYGGFAAGALIARFLLNAGVLGTLVGGVLGGFMGGALSHSPTDAMGFASSDNLY